MATIDQVQPQKLYRYRSLRSLKRFERELKALEEGHIFCAAYDTLNDPMEGVFRSSKVFRESDNYRDTRRAIVDNKTQIGMSSFSEVHDHELMWAHYADQYRGICIAYSFAKLLDSLGDDVSFVRMYYNEMVPIIRHSRQEPADVAKMVLSYKNYRWLYEREWRMFAPLGKAPYADKSCVARVYLGSRIASDKRNKIIRAMNSLEIETYDMKIEKYSITFESCS
jgi:hypothetical protein